MGIPCVVLGSFTTISRGNGVGGDANSWSLVQLMESFYDRNYDKPDKTYCLYSSALNVSVSAAPIS